MFIAIRKSDLQKIRENEKKMQNKEVSILDRIYNKRASSNFFSASDETNSKLAKGNTIKKSVLIKQITKKILLHNFKKIQLKSLGSISQVKINIT